MQRYIYWAFILMVLLILVVYSSGAVAAGNAFSQGITRLIWALTGRDANGRWHNAATMGPGAIRA